jgi:tetratricopeptide (TPR) repeat protein
MMFHRFHALGWALLALPPLAHADEPRFTPEITAMLRESARDWLDRATAAEGGGHPLEAEGFYRRALDADPTLLPAHLGYARTLDARGHRAEAREVLARVPRHLWTVDDTAALSYAAALRAVGALDESLAVLRERRDSVMATRTLAEEAAHAGRFPEALAAARRLVELSPDPSTSRAARVLVRALERLVGEADAVRAPCRPTGFRRVLMGD